MPYGFPSGRQLLARICDGLASLGRKLASQLLKVGFNDGELLSFREALYKSMQPSVDAFLEYRPEYLEVGKAAIAAALIPYEDPAKLGRGQDGPHWYEYLFTQLSAPKEDFANNQLRVVTFNYDRSFEYFLLQALQHTYGVTDLEAAELLRLIPIRHVYGQLGSLPQLSRSASDHLRNYEAEVRSPAIRSCSSQIQIVHEISDEEELFADVREWLAETRKVAFVGFGYHPTNLRRLGVDKLGVSQEVYGSAFGLMDAEKKRAASSFGTKPALGLEDEDALAVLRRLPILD